MYRVRAKVKRSARHVIPARACFANQWQPASQSTKIKIDQKKCPGCGGTLVEKTGKFGKFIGCKNYPKCKFTQNIEKITVQHPQPFYQKQKNVSEIKFEKNRLPLTHPFVVSTLQLEELELKEGSVSDKIIDIRSKLKKEFPKLYDGYMQAKNNKQQGRIGQDKIERIKNRPTSSWLKNAELKKLTHQIDN